MLELKKGNTVRVRMDSNSPYKGHFGTIEFDPIDDSVGYVVKIKSEEYVYHHLIKAQDLELINDIEELVKTLSDTIHNRLARTNVTTSLVSVK
jgi:hypothetical protein